MSAVLDTPAAGPEHAQAALLKLQAPIITFSGWLDHVLMRWAPGQPWLLWAVHLALAVLWTLLAAWLVSALCRRLGKWAQQRGQGLAADLLRLGAPTLRWMVLLAGLSDAIEEAWPMGKGPVRWIAGTFYVLSAIVATRGGVRLLRLVIDSLLRPSLDEQRLSELSNGRGRQKSMVELASSTALLPLVQRLGSILVWLVGLIVVLDHFGQNVSSVVAAFGVTSLAIGLAAQQALSNIIAGLVLAVDHPFRPGDRIRLPSGDSGEVLETGMRATHIRLYDGCLLVVPNADLVSSRLINQSTETLVRAEVRVTAPATIDIERLSAEMTDDAAKALSAELLPQPPRVQLLTVAEKVDLALILWLPRGADVPAIEEDLRRRALKRLQALLAPPLPSPPPAK